MKNYLILVLKGTALGTANVIPGVSGGTIALITGIFEQLINSIKSFDLKALKLLFSGKIKQFIEYTDLKFLAAVFLGISIAIISVAKLFGYLFDNYPIYIWAYFFGLILASVYFVGKTINKWTIPVIITLILGILSAFIISILNPATENDNLFYLIICGIVSICSMILPGLSGSFILILMGNYKLVVIDSINNMRLEILFPFLIGMIIGLVVFSRFISWILKKFRDQTIALLTGFIFGSLGILWPWKHKIYLLNNIGNQILHRGHPVVIGYQKYIPTFNTEVIIAISLMIIGIVSIWALERTAKNKV